jgi:hypothetical protein
MTHEELLAKIDEYLIPTQKMTGNDKIKNSAIGFMQALRAVVELHKPQEITLPNGEWGTNCGHCDIGLTYPCLTIEAIEKELL